MDKLRGPESAFSQIRLNVTPWRIVVENGRAIGVETTDGELIRARRFVVSGLNPQQTFLELIETQHLPHAWRKKVADFRYNLLAPLFSLNLNLSEPPRFQAAVHARHLDRAFMVILGLSHVDQFSEIVSAHETSREAHHILPILIAIARLKQALSLGHNTQSLDPKWRDIDADRVRLERNLPPLLFD